MAAAIIATLSIALAPHPAGVLAQSTAGVEYTISTVAGNGVRSFSGDGDAATSASLNGPSGVAVDQNGSLYIADYSNQRIRKVTPDGVIRTVAGNGTYGFSGDGGPATSAAMKFQRAVAVDRSGNLFIAEWANHR